MNHPFNQSQVSHNSNKSPMLYPSIKDIMSPTRQETTSIKDNVSKASESEKDI